MQKLRLKLAGRGDFSQYDIWVYLGKMANESRVDFYQVTMDKYLLIDTVW